MNSPVFRVLLGRNHPANRGHRIIQGLKRRGITVDANQRELIRLLARTVHVRPGITAKAGCYIYGPPGRGKSMILDELYSTLDPATSARHHFHDFFHAIQQAADTGRSGPMGSIFMRGLQRQLEGISFLCFDEFHCVEPGDAMFMARLVGYCKDHGITLLATSNYAPEKLLDDPYFHHLIEPTIAKLRAGFTIFELDGRLDYRTLAQPVGVTGGYRAGSLNAGLTPPPLLGEPGSLDVGHDTLHPVHVHDRHLSIDFDLLCRTRRNTRDYIDLAERFNQVSIPGIPCSEQMPLDEQRRFANLLDVFYDRDVRLHLYAADDLSALGQDLPDTERQRLASRLAQLPRTVIDIVGKY